MSPPFGARIERAARTTSPRGDPRDSPTSSGPTSHSSENRGSECEVRRHRGSATAPASPLWATSSRSRRSSQSLIATEPAMAATLYDAFLAGCYEKAESSTTRAAACTTTPHWMSLPRSKTRRSSAGDCWPRPGAGIEHQPHGGRRAARQDTRHQGAACVVVALMVCTCPRWDRVTTRLIAAVEDSALLDDAELDRDGLQGARVASWRRARARISARSDPAVRAPTSASIVVATLHLRNVPADVNATLAADASARGVSKNHRVIEALRRGLGLDQLERSDLIDQIRRG